MLIPQLSLPYFKERLHCNVFLCKVNLSLLGFLRYSKKWKCEGSASLGEAWTLTPLEMADFPRKI